MPFKAGMLERLASSVTSSLKRRELDLSRCSDDSGYRLSTAGISSKGEGMWRCDVALSVPSEDTFSVALVSDQ